MFLRGVRLCESLERPLYMPSFAFRDEVVLGYIQYLSTLCQILALSLSRKPWSRLKCQYLLAA